MPKAECLEAPISSLEHFYRIAGGSIGGVELDKGGYWSSQDRIWVDQKMKQHIEPLSPPEKQLVATLGQVGLRIGRIFERQLADAKNGIMWSNEALGADGAERILAAYEQNPDVADPYSLLTNGLDCHSVPYSQAYRDELEGIRQNLDVLLSLQDTSLTEEHRLFIKAMLAAYEPDDSKTTDYSDMGMVDTLWVGIPADADWLFMAQPMEIYHDPARVEHSQHSQIAKWANRITDKKGIGPWRTFFEFRLLMKDESMVTEEEIEAIRDTSKLLFKSPDEPEVSTSTEFRRLIMASGNGAHPAKTAKNYPNFEDIRDTIGYKNVLYTNMIEEGVRTHILPALQTAFDHSLFSGYSEAQMIRGSALRVVAHEENHPFRRFRDTPLEELKATINGMHAATESEQFSEIDINSLILTEIGAALYGRHRLLQARHDNNTDVIKGFEAYDRADTIMLNYLANHGAFIENQSNQIVDIDFETAKRGVQAFVKELESVRLGAVEKTIPQFYADYERETIWDKFRIMEVKN